MTQELVERYRGMVTSGRLAADSAQAVAIEKLQMLSNRLARYTPPTKTDIFAFFTRKSARFQMGSIFAARSDAARPC